MQTLSLCTYGGNRFSQQIFTRNTNFNLCNNRRDETLCMPSRQEGPRVRGQTNRSIKRSSSWPCKIAELQTDTVLGEERKVYLYLCILHAGFQQLLSVRYKAAPQMHGNYDTPFMFIFATLHISKPPHLSSSSAPQFQQLGDIRRGRQTHFYKGANFVWVFGKFDHSRVF